MPSEYKITQFLSYLILNRQIIVTIKERILQASSIVIVTHTNPDGDAIGSSLGFYHFLLSLNRKMNVKVIVPNEFPSFLKWMPGVNDILVFSANEKAAVTTIADADLCFCLDFNSLKRTDKLTPYLEASTAFKISCSVHSPINSFVIASQDPSTFCVFISTDLFCGSKRYLLT